MFLDRPSWKIVETSVKPVFTEKSLEIESG